MNNLLELMCTCSEKPQEEPGLSCLRVRTSGGPPLQYQHLAFLKGHVCLRPTPSWSIRSGGRLEANKHHRSVQVDETAKNHFLPDCTLRQFLGHLASLQGEFN